MADPAEGRTRRVFVLSGAPERRSVMASWVEEAGHAPFLFDSVLDVLASELPGEAVLIDCAAGHAPAYDPVGVARALRHLSGTKPRALLGVDVPAPLVSPLLEAGADDALVIGAHPQELGARLWNALRTRRTDDRARLNGEQLRALLSIGEAATAGLDLDEMLGGVVRAIASAIPVQRCSVVLHEAASARAWVMASHDVPDLRRMPIDLERYPELKLAITSRRLVVVDDMHSHPLLSSVRPLLKDLPLSTIMVAPLMAGGDALGALFLRCSRDRAFDPDEQAFIRAAATTIASSVRNASLHEQILRQRQDLEMAYAMRIAELREANRQLREAGRKKDELLEVCAHDLRGPLQIAGLRAAMVKSAGAEDRRHLEIIQRQLSRMSELVTAVLERGPRFGDSFRPQPLDLVAFVQLALESLRTLSDAAGQQLRLEAGEEPLPVVIDPSALAQVLENLVRNAVAHSPRGGTLRFVLRAEGSARVRLELHDQGPGVPPEHAAFIFERYTSSGGQDGGGSGRGLGLGLAICRDVIELHGGAIWVQPGERGAIFVFELPRAPEV